MATRIWETQVTVPAGTLPAAPQVTKWVTEDDTLVDVEIEIPPGHNGLTGIKILKGGSPLIPYSPNSWIIANDYSRLFPVDDYVPTSDVTIVAYNQGAYPHTFYLRATIADTPSTGGAAPPLVSTVLPISSDSFTADPLSPAGLLGAGVANALASGDITASDLVPAGSAQITLPAPDTSGVQ